MAVFFIVLTVYIYFPPTFRRIWYISPPSHQNILLFFSKNKQKNTFEKEKYVKFGQIDKKYKKYSQNRTKWVDIFGKLWYSKIRKRGKATFFRTICTKFNFFNFTPLTFLGIQIKSKYKLVFAVSGTNSHFIKLNKDSVNLTFAQFIQRATSSSGWLTFYIFWKIWTL